MFYILFRNRLPIEVSDKIPSDGTWKARNSKGDGWASSREFESQGEADGIASYLTFITGDQYLSATGGTNNFAVIKAPVLGDVVSKGFNGDYYPCGTITKITPTYQIETSDGTKFRRRGQSGGWQETGRGFSMIAGFHDERNPSF